MSRGPFSLLSSRMLDVRATAPYRASRCVAPRDIFPDYDHVMALLRGEEDRCDQPDVVVTEVTCRPPEERGVERTFDVASGVLCSPGSAGDDSTLFDDDYDDGEYLEKPHARQAASDISNIYSSRAIRNRASRRKTRRSKPYESRCQPKEPVEQTEADLHERCTYVDPEDGQRCNKINRSPQEAGRHWRSCHLYKEAKAMLTGAMAVGQGTAITSKMQLDEVAPSIQCPFCSALITRSDAMRRHIRTNCKVLEEAD